MDQKAIDEAYANLVEKEMIPGVKVKMTHAKMTFAPYGFPREITLCGRLVDVLCAAKMSVEERSKYMEMSYGCNLEWWCGVSQDYIMALPKPRGNSKKEDIKNDTV